MFKIDIDIDKLEENKEETNNTEQNSTKDDTVNKSSSILENISHDDSSSTTSCISNQTLPDSSQVAQMQENAMKVFKQHLEIVKLKEELDAAKKEKEELEEEISSRNKEIYEINERIIVIEMNHATVRQQDLLTIQDLKEALDRQSKSEKVSYDLLKFKDCLERLKCDLELLKLSEIFSNTKKAKNYEENSKENEDSFKQDEAFLGDSLKEAKNKSSNESNFSSQNMSSEKFIFENIQRSIDIIGLIQIDMEAQNKEDKPITKSESKKNKDNDTENTTTIMQDIEFISSAVGDNVITNQEDSFLNSVCSDINISKFDDGTIKFSISASVLEEKENKIKELIAVIESQSKTLLKLNKSHNELKSEKSRIQQSLEERTENSIPDIKNSKGYTSQEIHEYKEDNREFDNDSEIKRLAERIVQMETEYRSERDRHLEIINNDTLK